MPGRKLFRGPCVICNSPVYATSKGTVTCSPKCGYELRSKSLVHELDEDRKKILGDLTRPPVGPAETPGPVAAPPAPLPHPQEHYHHEPAPPPPPPAEVKVSTDRWEIPAPTGTTGRYERVVFWPDTHLPYQDDKAVALALRVVEYYQPHRLILLGDTIDCAGFSRFPRDTVDARNRLSTELAEWSALAELLKMKTPGAIRDYIRGNHEARIEKWLYGQPQLHGFDGFNLGYLLKLGDHGFTQNVHEELTLCNGSLTVTHGSRIGGQFAGTAARQEMARYGTSGVSGHTHRLAKYVQRDKVGLRAWVESGHLAANPPHYAPTVQNWAQGVTVGELSVDGNDFVLEPIEFRLSYRCRVGGRELVA